MTHVVNIFSTQSNFNYCRKVLSMKHIFINIKTKQSTPKFVLRWEFASVYIVINLPRLGLNFDILNNCFMLQKMKWDLALGLHNFHYNLIGIIEVIIPFYMTFLFRCPLSKMPRCFCTENQWTIHHLDESQCRVTWWCTHVQGSGWRGKKSLLVAVGGGTDCIPAKIYDEAKFSKV